MDRKSLNMCDISHEDIKIATMNYIDNINKNSPDKNKLKTDSQKSNQLDKEEEITKKKKRNRKKKKKTDIADNEQVLAPVCDNTAPLVNTTFSNECPDNINTLNNASSNNDEVYTLMQDELTFGNDIIGDGLAEVDLKSRNMDHSIISIVSDNENENEGDH